MKSMNSKKIAGIGLLTAVVIVLQALGSFIRLGPFSISLVLVPIVIGASLYGTFAGGWLGFVFGVAVLISGDASLFLAVNPAGTVITVIVKGLLAGLAAAGVYQLLAKKNKLAAVLAAAFVCPIVNTGVFLIGCRVFFYATVAEWAQGLGFGDNVVGYMFLGLVGGNFLVELIANMILCPVITRLIKVANRRK